MIEFNHHHPSATNPLLLPPPSKVVGPVHFDTETTGLHPDDGARVSVISLAFRVEDEDQPVSVAYPFGQGPDSSVKFFDKLPDDGEWRGKHDLGQRAWRHLTRWLNSAGAGLVGHNIKFDILQMNGQAVPGYPGVDLTERVLFDTMVMAAEVWPRGPLALKKIATQLWGLDADEEQRALAPYLGRKTDPRFDLVPWPVMFEYARRDAELTMMVFEQMATELYESTALGRFLPMEMDVNRALIRMEVAGLPYDPEMSRDFARAIDARMEEIQAQLPFNVKPNDIKKFYFSTEPNPSAPDPTRPGLGLEPIETTPTGQPKMTAPIVDRMAAQGVPYTRELREYNRLKSANSKWYYPFADRAGADGRIRTSFRHTGGTKSGRFALPLDAPVATYNGWRAIGELQVGDDLMGADGTVRRVIHIPFEGECDVWEVELDDGQVVECSDHHLWRIRDTARKSHRRGTDEVITTEQLSKRELSYMYIPTTEPVQYQHRTVRIDPYVLGVLLGNGDITEYPRFSVFEQDEDVAERFTERCKDEVVRGAERADRSIRYGLQGGQTRADLRRYGLKGTVSHNKFVPKRYMTLNSQQRLDLLRGLMDTDGSISKNNSCSYSTVSHQLAQDVCELVRSLGGVAHVKEIKMPKLAKHQPYQVTLRLPVCPFYSKRKAERWSKPQHPLYRRVVRVERTERRVDMRCITTSAPDGLFLTSGYTVTHNSSSRINLQAVPKDYALQLPVPTPRQVVASAVRDLPADWGLFDLDLEQAELRVAALYAGCEPMLEHIREGRDSHGETATQLFGVSPGDSDWDMYRSIAKRANFSLIFGSGPVSFHEMLSNQAGLDLPMREVRRIVYDWRDLYPEFGAAIESAQGVCERFGFVEGLLGRRRYYARDEDAHSAFNQVVQSSLATYAKMWTLSTDRLCRELDLPARGRRDGVGRGGLLLVVHDSQVLLLPNEEHESIVGTICQTASDIWDEAFPGVPGGADWERWA